MKTILSFGSGRDSSALLLYHLYVKSLDIDAVIFSDTGAERRATYVNLKRFKSLAEKHGIPFYICRHKESIISWTLRLGVLPLLPTSRQHVCSRKFKAEPIEKLTKQLYPGERINFIIGIEAKETRRVKRFTPPKDSLFTYSYPLIDMDMDRDAVTAFLESYGFKNIPKSACVICPYSSRQEIVALHANPKDWQTIQKVEHNFKRTSPIKHAKWLAAGQPLNKANRAPAGMWKHDTYSRGARLFARTMNGRQLSVDEWAACIENGQVRG